MKLDAFVIEWTKLLLFLEECGSSSSSGGGGSSSSSSSGGSGSGSSIDCSWMLQRARDLFDAAVTYGWDQKDGGLVYCFDLDPPHAACDADKYHWVHAEAFAAAAMLAKRTRCDEYLEWFDRLWKYCWSRFVDHDHGAWYCRLGRDGMRMDDRKSPMGKVDYHSMGACHDAVDAFLGMQQ